MEKMAQAILPEAAFPDLDSMLSRKFGKEVANYFSGSYTHFGTPPKVH